MWRFVQGASGGGGIVLARAVAADLTYGVAAARLFSLFMTLSSVAPILAPVLGGVLLATGPGAGGRCSRVLAVDQPAAGRRDGGGDPRDAAGERRQRGGLRATGRAFLGLARDRAFAGYALTVAFAYASLFGYIAGSSFALQDLYGLSATQFSLVFALNAAGSIVLGLLNARLREAVPGPPDARGRAGRLDRGGGAAAGAVVAGAGLVVVLAPLFVVVASRGLVSANATVLGIERSSAAGSASAVLGALMFAGGVLVTPLLASGGEGTAVPMAAVVAGGAVAALLATVLMTPAERPGVGTRSGVTSPA